MKEDERILGKDNLQSFNRGIDNGFAAKNIEILGLQKEAIGNKVNVKTGSGESLTDLKLADAAKDQLSQNNSYNNLNIKSDPDSFARQDQFAKAANNSRAAPQTTYTQENGNYKIVNFTKTQDGIELKLEPVSMGKVNIRFEFTAEGKLISQ